MQTIFRFLVAGKSLGVPKIETNTHLQFKHAFPRCNGERRWGELDLDLCEFMIGGFVQIFEWALKNLKPWLLWNIYMNYVKDQDRVRKGKLGWKGKKPQKATALYFVQS